jgi:AraC family transcriptional regulator of adaptative response / DNA-3-methyladenine glycosylase II
VQSSSILLPYSPPYAWQAMVRFLEARSIPGVECVLEERYLRTISLSGQHGVLVVEPGPDSQIRLTVHGAFSTLQEIELRVRRIFDLDADPRAIADHLGRDPALAPLVRTHPGLRVPGAWDGFELAVRGILGQQITVVQATRLAGQLVAQHGEPLCLGSEVDPALTHVFPSPERMAQSDLSMLGMPGARRASLRSLAASVAADPSLFTRGATLDQTVRKLRALPGIGEWTAQYIALRALREPDAFLAADVGLHRALARADGSRPTPKEMLALANAWRPYRGYAVLHLWHSLGHAPPKPTKVPELLEPASCGTISLRRRRARRQ